MDNKDKKENLYHKRNQKDLATRMKDMKIRLDGVCEALEQIDELSKDTLKSYVKKSQEGKRDLERAAQKGDKKAQHRQLTNAHGVVSAKARLAKEEVEQIDELSKGKLQGYITSATRDAANNGRDSGIKIATKRDNKPHENKIHKRIVGVSKAALRLSMKEDMDLTNEEIGHILELSKKTLTSYTNKARKNLQRSAQNGVITDKMVKRADGVFKAQKKSGTGKNVVSEDIEQIDELSKELVSRAKASAEALPSSPIRNVAKSVRVVKKATKYINKIDSKSPSVFKKRFTEETQMIRFKAYLKLQEEAAKNEEIVEDAQPEQIDELSNKTLNSYVSKATTDAHTTLKKKVEPRGMAKAYRTVIKRAEGIKKAKARFKEDVDHEVEDGTQE